MKQCNHYIGRWPAFAGLVVESGKIVYYFWRGWI